MVNKENIQKAIDVMQRIADTQDVINRQLFYLPFYQAKNKGFYGTTIYHEDDAIDSCGTTCCFVGWLAISPEFQELGVTVSPFGQPLWKDQFGKSVYPIRELLGITHSEYDKLIYGVTYDGEYYYGKPEDEVTPDDVIKKLQGFLE